MRGCTGRRTAVLVAGLALGGCATHRMPLTLRRVDDAVPSSGASRLYVLPDSAVAVGVHAWARLEGDSLILYRPIERLGPNHYSREVHRYGPSGVAIAGYTRADGRRVEFPGWVKAEGERLHFRRAEPRGLEKGEEPRELTLGTDEVRSIDVWLPSAGRTALLYAAVLVVGAAGLGLAAASSFRESAM